MNDQEIQDYINNAFTEELILNAENHLLNIMSCRYEKYPTENNSQEWLDYTNFVCRRRCQSGKSELGELKNKWISVEDRLPLQMPENIPTMNWVIVTTSHYPNQVSIARFDGERWEFLDTDSDWTYGAICGDCTSAFDIKEITHWMPLPEPPKE